MILDTGGGGHPYPQADVILERFRGKESRGAELVIPPGKKYIFGDIEAMPFKDKSFNFIWCSMVLEHVDNPEQACQELQRVGKTGYIETPTSLWERLFGRKYHLWVIRKMHGALYFTKNPFKKELGNFFDSLYSHNQEFKQLFHSNIDLFSNRFDWVGSFECHIVS